MPSTLQCDNICRLLSFNCKSIKRSVDFIKACCETCDIIALQETWLLPHDLPYLGSIHEGFGHAGTSAVDTAAGILRGRPHGGVALLWRKDICQSVSIIECDSPRLVCIKVTTGGRQLLIMSVYMPVDISENLLEFTQCLGEICAIVETADVESVIILGDFNAHPSENFGKELLDFCLENGLTCADIVRLGLHSDSYTYLSEAHGSRRWLDHCLVSELVLKSIVDIKINNEVYWSDHFPMVLEININIVRCKVNLGNRPRNYVIWGERSSEQVGEYHDTCNNRLRDIDLPEELKKCCGRNCDNVGHHMIINHLYSRIVGILVEASVLSCKKSVKRKGGYITGWNKHVSAVHREARLKFLEWVASGKPRSGSIYQAFSYQFPMVQLTMIW
ncbi:uncharacterized protein LOC134654471 [Cydia amplana]|uniref:uncharacterized protein LOC134654471 n=1 Tax=Cydia amplana TaxID=1869771 RepID=UPI002FE6B698